MREDDANVDATLDGVSQKPSPPAVTRPAIQFWSRNQ
jgi:hypothetical protein